MSNWRRERVSTRRDDVVEFIAEKPRSDEEVTSYLVSTTDGLLLGRVWRKWHPHILRLPWWAEGWTPATDAHHFGPFETRWEAMGCLQAIERHDEWPGRLLIHRQEVAA